MVHVFPLPLGQHSQQKLKEKEKKINSAFPQKDKQRIPQKVTVLAQFRAICSEFLGALLSLFSTFQGSSVDLSQICDNLNHI